MQGSIKLYKLSKSYTFISIILIGSVFLAADVESFSFSNHGCKIMTKGSQTRLCSGFRGVGALRMQSEPKKPRVVVVGAGWGGWAAAKALSENGCEVFVLDRSPDPAGLAPYKTPTGKPFEPGTRGFWKDYPNIEDMMSSLGCPVESVLTEFTTSSFYSPDGLEATAPVFSSSSLPQLPSPLGQVFATFSNFKRLPVQDRITMAGILYAMLDFNRDEKTFAAYDRMTAHELFIRAGVSRRLVEDFIKPTLLVGLFKPPEELSAAVAMELLYFYAIAHQTSFDVRWVKRGTVQESFIRPLASSLIERHALTVLPASTVQQVRVPAGFRFKGALSHCYHSGQRRSALNA